MSFVGRGQELDFLTQHYAAADNRVLVVYGQRGVGKTALLNAFAEEKTCAYYMARSCSDREQRAQWGRELQLSAPAQEVSYGTLLLAMLPQGSAGKKVLIIDEFHHLIKSDETFFTQLLTFVHTCGEEVLVILSTAATGWVENHMVRRIGSDAVQLAGILKIRELDFSSMRILFPTFDEADSVMLYAILGGVPGLWMRLDAERSAVDNVISRLLDKNSALFHEMSSYLAEELREPAVYNTILCTMAAGNNKLNDMYHCTGFSRAKISVYLKNLMEIDLVEKTGAGIYRIAKSHIRFYFYFIFPHLSFLESIAPAQFYELFVADAFQEFLRETYREI